MSYPINTTNSTKLFDLLDGTTNSELGVTLIGRNYTNYGEFQNENFVRLLENFASPQDPSKNGAYNPLVGTLWYDTTNKRIRVYNGTDWVPVSERTVSTTAPTSNKIGDEWYSVTDKQLFSWDGAEWVVVGPPYSATQGKSGSIVEIIIDDANVRHTVVSTYTNNHLISITSFDDKFTPAVSIPHFGDINPGINLSNTTVLTGKAEDAVRLGGSYANTYARTDVTSTFTQNVGIVGNLILGDAAIKFANKSLVVTNRNYTGNVEIYVNTPNGNVKSIVVDGSTGIALMPPTLNSSTSPDALTNKKYVDYNVVAINGNVEALAVSTASNLAATRTLLTGQISVLRTDTNANLTTAQTGINSNVTTLSNNLASNVATFSSDISTLFSNVNTIDTTILTLAPLNSPALTGVPTTPTASLGTNSSQIASTGYVDATGSALSTAFAGQLAATQAALNSTITTGLALRAPLLSPTFTGTPAAPTPSSGDNSTKVATTAFVQSAIAAQKFPYTVSTNPPSGGNTGDFWFQIG
jgi:hypothetical protein